LVVDSLDAFYFMFNM